MPKDNIDYSNTIIYKISCNDETINDIYVGHTTNFFVRKYQHKNACNNIKNDLKIYKKIRENGGWDNWSMIEIAKYNCKDSTEARIKEQFHYEELKASLNSCPPYVNIKNKLCSTCNIQCNTAKSYETHKNCNKHKNLTTQQMTDILVKKSSEKFHCKICDYYTSRKSQYERHILTDKHYNLQNSTFFNEKVPNSSNTFTCGCGKEYKDRSGLWKHKKNCKYTNQEIIDQTQITPELIMSVLQQNKELQQMLVEQNKTIIELSKNNTITNNNNITNSHNKTFNLQFFLNEECKDALNISEFVSSIKVQLEDLETTGRLGYVEGVSRIINKNLNELDQNKRPIHCSDVKREVLYIKNDDQWVKENENKPILTKAIKQIANENIKQIGEWRKKYPDCTDSDSRKNDMYLNIVSNAMSGTTVEEQSTNYEKIISKVAKEVTIEK